MDDFIRRPDRPNIDMPTRRSAEPVTRPIVNNPPRPTTVVSTSVVPQQPAVATMPHKTSVPQPTKLPPRARAPITAIVVAVFVSIGLIALTIFAYNKQQANDKPATNTTVQSTTPDTTQTIQDSSDNIDKTLNNLNDSTDFSETDLSDQTLNL